MKWQIGGIGSPWHVAAWWACTLPIILFGNIIEPASAMIVIAAVRGRSIASTNSAHCVPQILARLLMR